MVGDQQYETDAAKQNEKITETGELTNEDDDTTGARLAGETSFEEAEWDQGSDSAGWGSETATDADKFLDSDTFAGAFDDRETIEQIDELVTNAKESDE